MERGVGLILLIFYRAMMPMSHDAQLLRAMMPVSHDAQLLRAVMPVSHDAQLLRAMMLSFLGPLCP